ncbi:MAG: hypothetical protein V4547_17110 [Bacteroidota bacterium]
MDLKSIKAIIDSKEYPDSVKENLIIHVLSDDDNVIPIMLKILDGERDNNKELIMDSNAELSRALLTLEDPKLKTKKPIIELKFVTGEIRKHYLKWQKKIRCTFKMEGLP